MKCANVILFKLYLGMLQRFLGSHAPSSHLSISLSIVLLYIIFHSVDSSSLSYIFVIMDINHSVGK